MTVSSVTGAVWCDASQAPTDSPNGPCAGVRTPTNLKSFGHISGIIDRNSNDFLVGVFLGKDKPGKPTPPRLNFSKSKLGTNFKKLAPELDQTFFIGTGRTKSGDLHKYKVPKHATRLYLGIADGYGFGGDPGYYDDNGGKYRVKVHFK
jgi:hypothetical protein